MLPINWKKFLHPAGVYRLEYPAQWDQAQKDEARSCGFGPHDRDDVGLWISLMPVSVDSDRLAEELPKILSQALPHMEGGNVRRDPTLRHYGVKADVHKEGEGGHYWMIAGGDVVLFASSQLPAASAASRSRSAFSICASDRSGSSGTPPILSRRAPIHPMPPQRSAGGTRVRAFIP